MKKKFWFFFTVTVALFAIVAGMYFRYIYQSEYRVFIESFDHGVLTVDSMAIIKGITTVLPRLEKSRCAFSLQSL